MDVDSFFKRYKFKPDDFQHEAVLWLSKGFSVLVSAPTGSGKTVVAEYALFSALEKNEKIFYTTPLKALSNQKFREFRSYLPLEKVGLLTGDNSINPEASVVVMTAEVLRNMLYEGSDLLCGLRFVVLDEIHYMDDPFRGQTWEEIIIQLPCEVKIVSLSATISNARQLGEWMDSLRGDVKVIYHEKRPVELKNFYFVGDSLIPLFAKDIHRRIEAELEKLKRMRDASRTRGYKILKELRPRRTKVIRKLASSDMLPAIYFLFSRSACDDAVDYCIEDGLFLNSKTEAKLVDSYLEEKVAPLEKADLECLDYRKLKLALRAGFASHHAGEVPLFKEAIEELFSLGLLKVVFATETLSLGINMPARSVVIESLTKWTGEKHRPLTPGEYRQLTGRAGRRSIDEVGYAVVLYQAFFSVDQIRALASRPPDPVVSSFQVTYNMATNLLARHSFEQAEKVINRSFGQYMADKKVVTLEAEIDHLQKEIALISQNAACDLGADARHYRKMEREVSRISRVLASVRKERRRSQTAEALSILKPGDVFLMGKKGAASVVAVVKKPSLKRGEPGVLVVDSRGRYRRVSTRSLAHPPRVIGAVDVERIVSPLKKVRASVGETMERLIGSFPEVNAVTPSEEESVLRKTLNALQDEFESYPCHRCEHRTRCLEAARRAEKLEKKVETAKKLIESENEPLSKKLRDVMTILEGFGYLSGETLTPKGILLKQIYNECDLLVVESLERGYLDELDPSEIVAFTSWFIYESKEDDTARRKTEADHEGILKGPLFEILCELEIIYSEIKGEEEKFGLDLLGALDTGFADMAFFWAQGHELEEILSNFPDRSVGDMVRTMKQILDLLRQIEAVTESAELKEKLHEAMERIDRGIVGYSSIESIIEKELI